MATPSGISLNSPFFNVTSSDARRSIQSDLPSIYSNLSILSVKYLILICSLCFPHFFCFHWVILFRRMPSHCKPGDIVFILCCHVLSFSSLHGYHNILLYCIFSKIAMTPFLFLHKMKQSFYKYGFLSFLYHRNLLYG